MTTKRRLAAAESGAENWFLSELTDYSDESNSARAVPRLQIVAGELRTSTISSDDFNRYRRASIEFIRKSLVNVAVNIQNYFFIFLLQADIVDSSTEVRNALHSLLTSRLNRPIDHLTASIVTALCKNFKPPAGQVVAEIFRKTRDEFNQHPDWLQIGVLACCVGRIPERGYTTSDLINDISRLRDEPNFEKRVSSRNTIWAALNPPTDAIEIITAAKRADTTHAANHPISIQNINQRFDQDVNRLLSRIQH